MDNVIDLASKRNNQQGNCEHEEVCEHCAWVARTASSFIDTIQELDVRSDAFREEVEGVIGYVKWVTRKQTMMSIAASLVNEVDTMDDVDEEE